MKNSYQHRSKHSSPHNYAGNSIHPKDWLTKATCKPANENIIQLVLKYPSDWFGYTEKLAKYYQLHEKHLDAAACYKALVEGRGSKVDDLICASIALFKGGEISDSLTYARQAYSKDSFNPTITKVFLECLICTNHPQEALEVQSCSHRVQAAGSALISTTADFL